MLTSEKVDQIATAMVAFQSKVKNPPKNKKNPHFGNKYTDLTLGLELLRRNLTAHGIHISQVPFVDGEHQMLSTRLQHISGQFYEGAYWVARLGGDQQKMAGALTYAKRQIAFAMTGICGDDDADGEEGGDAPRARRGTATKRQDQPPRELLAADASKSTADSMIGSMERLISSKDAQTWARDNVAVKASLHPADSARVSSAWTKTQARISAANAKADKDERAQRAA